VAGARNDVLAWALDALGWSPEKLASEVNRALGPDNRSRWISRTLPYKWRDCGVLPASRCPPWFARCCPRRLARRCHPSGCGRIVPTPRVVGASR